MTTQTCRVGASIVAGGCHVGTRGLGLLGADILAATASGEFGAGVLFNDGLVADREYRLVVTSSTFAPGALRLFENGAGEYSASGSATLTLYENSQPVGNSQITGGFAEPTLNLLATSCLQNAVSSSAALGINGVTALALAGAGCTQFSETDGVSVIATEASDGLGQQWLVARPRVWKVPYDPNVRTQSFSEKSPLETIWLVGDFKSLAPAVSNPQVLITRASGAPDPNPDAVRDGGPSVVDGTAVRQRVTGGVAGCNYTVTFLASAPDGVRLALSGVLPVRS